MHSRRCSQSQRQQQPSSNSLKPQTLGRHTMRRKRTNARKKGLNSGGGRKQRNKSAGMQSQRAGPQLRYRSRDEADGWMNGWMDGWDPFVSLRLRSFRHLYSPVHRRQASSFVHYCSPEPIPRVCRI
ncbi:hypothetical protein EX30DRAFT_211277 [Ascodesmis nigricans]|uniref:Uncharacterized protein n=1 Tax=Ascodesmis nigricans TaxID=341454 RepID=A0A4S2MJH4_9PEZI|nr:hypothetical protein EX30DRAFT_211277 [Ascodesmis nigricans]